jgi:ABC-type uncharacterized transport system auxiliary subunit
MRSAPNHGTNSPGQNDRIWSDNALALALTLALALSACAQPELPADHFYRLSVEPPRAARARPLLRGILQIERFAADGVTGARPLAYSRPGQASELQAYHYHFWAEPPTTLLQSELAAYLRQAGTAASVVTPELRLEPNHVISGKIKRFERLMSSPPTALVEIELSLTDRSTDRLVHQATYRAREKAAGPAMAATIAALSRAVEHVFADFLKDLGG